MGWIGVPSSRIFWHRLLISTWWAGIRKPGLISQTELETKLGDDVAAVYFECPSYLGFIDTQIAQLTALAKACGALSVVYVDPICLGVLAAPRDYGVDIVCGDLQSLGLHMNAGGGLAGFIATPDEERFVAENPAILISGAPKPGGQGWSFAWCTFDRTSYLKEKTPRTITARPSGCGASSRESIWH
ncbi:MAG: hypothetical protein Ct9H300mP16_02130 [Pseudomonadota bacterium]|nr:MAG: hypothetical protein Ct9H300mP16_02130 [Pseudomonadota bacterium]